MGPRQAREEFEHDDGLIFDILETRAFARAKQDLDEAARCDPPREVEPSRIVSQVLAVEFFVRSGRWPGKKDTE